MAEPVSTELLRQTLECAVSYLRSVQNPDGAFPGAQDSSSDAWATAECILALTAAGASGPNIKLAVQWLVSARRSDGSWSSGTYKNKAQGHGDVAATAYALRALAASGGGEDRQLIETARDWLVEHQRSDGGWGVFASHEARSRIGQTGFAISAIAHAPPDHRAAEAIQDGLFYLYSQQRAGGGWELAPGQEMDATLTAYALRGIIDVCRLRGHRPGPQLFERWLRNMEAAQNQEGSWPDWYGNPSSVEATGYAIEIATCIHAVSASERTGASWLDRALRFLAGAQGEHGGWGAQPGSPEAGWVTHSVVLALAKLAGRPGADRVALSMPPDFHLDLAPAGEPSGMYDFALSFSGSDREYARGLALRLQRGATVFYDRFEASGLWGANLIDRLSSVYRDRARLCLMLVSKEYVRRSWPRLERQSAQARALREGRDYILPVMLEPDVEVDGLLGTVGHLSAADYDVDTIAELAMQKLESIKRATADEGTNPRDQTNE